MERSTWVSAAKFTTAEGRCVAEDLPHRLPVGDVGLHEGVARVALDVLQAFEIAGVGELVQTTTRSVVSRRA